MASFNPTFTEEELQNEIWKPVVGFEEYYSVSNLGRIRREKRSPGTRQGHILKAHTNGDGYLELNLHKHGGKEAKKVHILVAAAFLGPCPIGQEVNHKNGDKLNCRVENLEYMTHLENIRHSHHVLNRIVPTRARGEKVSTSKLVEKEVREIRRRVEEGEGVCKIAREKGVHRDTIRRIKNRRYWKHVD